ncbi:MAG: DUF4293 domain-containing protein [Bacteroidia bacterium]|nr:DUF4293 domain-containing protein [Bacteroidia bacterium]
MLQRIQSIFLLVAMLTNLSILILPVWTFMDKGQGYVETVNALSIQAQQPGEDKSMTAFDHPDTLKMVMHVSAMGLSIVSGILLLITIFMFNDRMRQKRMAYISVILTMLLLVCLVVLTNSGPSIIAGEMSTAAFGFFMPVVSIMMIWLAINRIQKDEDLVNSVDRIR